MLRVPDAVRATLMGISLAFVAIGAYYRIQSQRSGERLDRTKEGWPLLIGVRSTGLFVIGSTIAWLYKPSLFDWASRPMPPGTCWIGVGAFLSAVGWMIWTFHSLGRNLTDTVVTRRDAHFVEHGPYRFVRNPMYLGILMLGASLGLALGTWLLPIAAVVMFTLLALRTRTEERYLIERFGTRYRNYMKRVGRFFPKLPG